MESNEKRLQLPETKEGVIAELEGMKAIGGSAEKRKLDKLKQIFYKLHNEQQARAREEFEAQGGKPAEFRQKPDEDEARFKKAMDRVKEERNEIAAKILSDRKENLEKKQAVIKRIDEMAVSGEEPEKLYEEFQELIVEWDATGEVPATENTQIWVDYKRCREAFYDNVAINKDDLEADMSANLAETEDICLKAEELSKAEDIVQAHEQLQKLRREYREAGPLAKTKREEVRTRFKEACTVVNKLHQDHFENIKNQEEANLEAKTAICEEIENIKTEELSGYKDWNRETDRVLALQEKWKTIGYTPRKMNSAVFDRYRKACDKFFTDKSDHFKQRMNKLEGNLEKKTALVEKAESLKDSEDWKETTKIMTSLQEDWKKTGPIPRKHNDELWERFIKACDHFFERRNKEGNPQRAKEAENMKLKDEITSKIKEMSEKGGKENELRRLIKEWNSIGFVPFRDKDRIYDEFHAAVDAAFLKIRGKAAVAAATGQRLSRKYDELINEIKTYENNLGFLTTASKKGGAIVESMKKKVEELKKEAEELRKKL